MDTPTQVVEPVQPAQPAQTPRFYCASCSKSYGRKDHLKRHELTHQVPQFRCSYDRCHAKFYRSDALARHISIHERGGTAKSPVVKEQSSISQNQSRALAEYGANGNGEANHRTTPHTALSVDHVYEQLRAAASATGSINYDAESDVASTSPSVVDAAPQDDQTSVESASPEEMIDLKAMLLDWSAQLDPDLSSTDAMVMDDATDEDAQPGSREAQTLHECINAFRQWHLPRLPCIHYYQDSDSMALKYAMAALGAGHVEQHKSKAIFYHEKAKEELVVSKIEPDLLHLQAQVLSIDFAIWSRNQQRRLWARHELLDASAHALDYLQDLPDSASEDVWSVWIHQEAYKRTIFALFVTITLASTFLGIESALQSQQITLSLPCNDNIWHATSSVDWDRELGPLSLGDTNPEIDFREAVHTLIHSDSWSDHGHEKASTFHQYICLCAMLEAISLSKRLSNNYNNVGDWRDGNSAVFYPREQMSRTLDVYKSLWSSSAHGPWNKQLRCHPREEISLLINYMTISLNQRAQYQADARDCYWVAVQAAVDAFVEFSHAGFVEISPTFRDTISRPGRHCAISAAKTLITWARTYDSLSSKKRTHNDLWMHRQVSQAVRRGLRPGVAVEYCGSLDRLTPAVSYLWNLMLGSADLR